MIRQTRAQRKLHLELLRTRAAAERLELSMALQDIAERLQPLRRAGDSLGSVARAVGGRGHLLGWLAAGLAALAQVRRFRRTALGTLAAGAIVLVVRYLRGSSSEKSERESETG